MKKLVGALTSASVSICPALATDLPVRPPLYKAPPIMAPFNWAGCYAGVTAGLVHGQSNISWAANPAGFRDALPPTGAAPTAAAAPAINALAVLGTNTSGNSNNSGGGGSYYNSNTSGGPKSGGDDGNSYRRGTSGSDGGANRSGRSDDGSDDGSDNSRGSGSDGKHSYSGWSGGGGYYNPGGSGSGGGVTGTGNPGSGPPSDPPATVDPGFPPGTAAAITAQTGRSQSATGFTGGGEIGCNWQSNNSLVFGIEGDLEYTGLNASTSGAVLVGNTVNPFTESFSSHWLSTIRGRVGVANGPWLFFATGGFAFANAHFSDSIFFPSAGTSNAASSSAMMTGWTVGGGVEWFFMPRWSVKAEYLYVDLGRKNFVSTNSDPATYPFANISHSHSLIENIGRVGLNFHF